MRKIIRKIRFFLGFFPEKTEEEKKKREREKDAKNI